MTICLIPAAGESTRWNGAGHKHLVLVGDQPLLVRLVNQVKARRCHPLVLTAHEDIAALLRGHCPVYRPAAHRWLLETLLHAPIDWTTFERHVVLLGDCIFTESALDLILNSTRQPQFYGDGGEIFALAFSPTSLLGWFQKGVKLAEDNPDLPNGKLWTLYRSMLNLPLDKYSPPRSRFFTWVTDGTTDIDSVEEYERFLEVGAPQ